MEREILTAALAPGAGCLSMEQLGRYADGALGADERAAAAAHIRGCLNCQAELALLQAVTSSSVRTEEADIVRDGVARLEQRATEIFGAGGVETSSRRRWLGLGMPPVAAVAAILLVVAGSLYIRIGKAPELPRKVTSGDEVTRSLAVAVRGPVGDQVEAPRRLEWLAVDRAVRYRVRLMEVDRREVWSAATSALGVDLPSSVRASLVPGRTLLWDVTAYDGADAAIAESGPQSFRLMLR
jgi:putative zinc finger protein